MSRIKGAKKEMAASGFYVIMRAFKNGGTEVMEFEPDVHSNRRTHPRVHFSEAIQFEQINHHYFGGSVGLDISKGGLRIRFNDYVAVGTELSLQISLPDQEIIECTGTIKWEAKEPFNDAYQAGIEFAASENVIDSKEKIHHYIESFPS